MSDSHDKITEVIRHHWDRRANTFDDEVGHGLASEEQRRAWHDLLSQLAGSAPRRALDVGCGEKVTLTSVSAKPSGCIVGELVFSNLAFASFQ